MRRHHTFLAAAALFWSGSCALAAEETRQPANDVAISGIELGDRLNSGPLLNDTAKGSSVEPEELRAERSQERRNRKVRIVYPF